MPLCRDCEHCQPDDDNEKHPYANARCERLTYVDLVSGETRNEFCGAARGPLGDCKVEGLLFLPRLDDAADPPRTGSAGPSDAAAAVLE